MRYEVKHSYAASRDGRRFGPWRAGEVVDLDQADAEWVERDSPGALRQPEPEPEPEPEAEAEADGEREKPASTNRQHRGGRNRSQ